MSWTYSNPGTSTKDAVRFYLGDTVTTEQKLQDEEIYFLLIQNDEDPIQAAAAAAESLAATAASWFASSADGVSLSVDQVQEKYMLLANSLRYQASYLGRWAAPYAGGTGRGDVESHEMDESVVQTDFGTGMHDNYEAGYQGGTNRKSLRGEW